MQATMLPVITVEAALWRFGADADLIDRIVHAHNGLSSARPDLREGILRFSQVTSAGMGVIGKAPAKRVRVMPEDGPTGTYANVLGLLNVLPELESFHRAHGIPESITTETLEDLPRHIRRHAVLKGEEGFGDVRWLSLHFRGLLYSFGRLQIERGRMCTLPWDELALRRTRGALHPGEIVYNLHIPAGGGLDPVRVDDSLARGHAILSSAFPEDRPIAAQCASWLLDPQLQDYLPETSNIIRFQKRFRVAGLGLPTTRHTLEFVFDTSGKTPVDEFPQDTALQRAMVAHVRAGRHWRMRSGWFPLDELPVA